ncbi:MAG: hypothetical protein J0H14_01725 [Alphaproteobacteria bacterium]|nr:hypothetical protein [Alphaproteobacteria bacterium]
MRTPLAQRMSAMRLERPDATASAAEVAAVRPLGHRAELAAAAWVRLDARWSAVR